MLSGHEAAAVLDRQAIVMEQLVSDAPLVSVLDSIVIALEELIAASRCSVLLLDDDGVLRHGSAPNLPAAYSEAIDGLVPGPLAGSCGTAVHLGEPVVVGDVMVDRRWDDFRSLARTHDISACWSSPIRARARVVGTFAVYSRVRHEPDERERELVRRFTHLASIAIDHERAARERTARYHAEMARESAERANHAKSQFVTALSHELRTPLQSITGFAESLSTLELSPHQRHKALQGITRASTHILSIVDDVLDLARVEAGAMPIQLEVIDAREVVAGACDLLQPLAEERGIDLVQSGPPLPALVDRRRLRQIILNLVSNALRFSGPTTSIRISTATRGAEALVTVEDEGPGISSELLDRLFVPFDRLGADAGREGGAGLGLVLARRLADAMGGSLTLKSAVGIGTTATVSLTRALEDELADAVEVTE
ncbi:MAG: GAF domain-containing sensor histidine kinase [Acidimicrobiales bacterium]|jgi:two-component system cell cycle sensor histidine kinase PleC